MKRAEIDVLVKPDFLIWATKKASKKTTLDGWFLRPDISLLASNE